MPPLPPLLLLPTLPTTDRAPFERRLLSSHAQQKGGGSGADGSGGKAVPAGGGAPGHSSGNPGANPYANPTAAQGGHGANARGGVPNQPSPPPHMGGAPPPGGAMMAGGVPGAMGWRGAPYPPNAPQPQMQFQTELMILQGDERIRTHREALRTRLSASGLNLEELEYAVRVMVMQGRFTGSAGVPETMLMPSLPERFLAPGSPFRTIAELASSIPWLLRVHQSMQWVQQMPNGLMTVQRLICPAASDLGGLAAPDGVLAIDWQKCEEVLARSAEIPPAPTDGYRPSMAGDPRFPRGAPPFVPRGGEGGMAPGAMMPPGTMIGGDPSTDGEAMGDGSMAMMPPPQTEGKGGGGGQRRNREGGRGGRSGDGGGRGGRAGRRGGDGGGNKSGGGDKSSSGGGGDAKAASGDGAAEGAAKSEGGSKADKSDKADAKADSKPKGEAAGGGDAKPAAAESA